MRPQKTILVTFFAVMLGAYALAQTTAPTPDTPPAPAPEAKSESVQIKETQTAPVGIATKTGDKIAFQFATLNVTSGFKGGSKTEVRPELEQSGEGGDHLLGTGRQRHLLTVIVNLGSLCANLLHHQGKVRACGKLINVLINIRGLGGERYTGSQSDDKTGKSHNLALTTRKQTVILRCMAL